VDRAHNDHETRDRPNALHPCPGTIETIGLVAPSRCDDARTDAETVFGAAGIETIEFRMTVTGLRAPVHIAKHSTALPLIPGRPTPRCRAIAAW